MLKSRIVKIINCLPGGKWGISTYMHFKRSIRFSLMGSPKDIFSYYYRTNNWGNPESVSGHGSTLQYTENIRKEIPGLMNTLGLQTILDAPCGDFNWFREIVKQQQFQYIGGDIVKELILLNKEKYANDRTRFLELDIIRDSLPKADLWLCRDCLFHFSYDDIFSTLQNFLQSDISYLLTTTHSECGKNRNITTGDFRMINLELPPFSFCEPAVKIQDWIEGYPVRHLALWKRTDLMKALSVNPEYLKRTARSV